VEILHQTKKFLELYLGEEVGIIGDNEFLLRHVTVATWQSLKNDTYDDYLNSVDIVVVDEAQHIGAKLLRKEMKRIPAIYRLGMSGTLWREDGADLEIISACGKKIASVSYTDLLKYGYIVPARFTLVKLAQKEYFAWQSYDDVYRDYIVNNKVRNKALLDCASTLVSQGRRVLIFVSRTEHGDILSKLSNYPFLYATHSKRREIIDAFRDGTIQCLISTSVLQEGFDVPECDALVLAGPQKSTIATLQKIGRALRKSPMKTDSIIVDTFDQAKYLSDASRRRLNMYQKERAWKVESIIDTTRKDESLW
jgi:superfamily II DNA or RNA helicase